jgi:hypothetical protein
MMGITERNSTGVEKKYMFEVQTYLHTLVSGKSEQTVLGFASPHLQDAP